MFACMRIGAVICPISPICPEGELRHRLGLTEARVCITLSEWAGYPLASIVTGLSAELTALEHVLVVGGPAPDGALDFHDHFVDVPWEERRGKKLDGLELKADEPFVVLFTSGTTGESRGVLHGQNTIHSAVRGYVDLRPRRRTGRRRIHSAVPLLRLRPGHPRGRHAGRHHRLPGRPQERGAP
jgi:cyclohexanecarboxylate-CoA ligase